MRPLTPSQEEPPSADEAVAKLRLWFHHHYSLQEVEMQDILQWDRTEHVIKKGKQFETKWSEVPR